MCTHIINIHFTQSPALETLLTEDKSGSIGLVLNCPSPLKVKDADSVGHVAGCFAQQHVYVGGPVENNTFLALHTWGECEQAHEIISGLYTTDVRHLNDHVASHAHDAAEIAPRPVKVCLLVCVCCVMVHAFYVGYG